MPNAAPSRCTKRCGRLATANGRCDEHQRKAWENTSARNKAIDKTRWLKVSKQHLDNEPQCRACGSTHRLRVDHITEVADGGDLYDDSNLQTLCERCDDVKTTLARRIRAARRAHRQG